MIAFTMYSEKPFAISTVMEGGIASSVRLTTASIRTGPSSANALAIPSSTSDGSFGRLPRIPTASDHMRLGPGGEGGNLLVPDMQPLGLACLRIASVRPFRLSPTMPQIRLTPATERVSANWPATLFIISVPGVGGAPLP